MIAKTIAMACIACGGLVARAAAEVPPHEARGLYAIWYQAQREYLLDLPFIRGGQVFCQWAEVEAREGEYDWSALDRQLKLLHEKGLKCTVQINGNQKPDWMFERIPYWPNKLSQVKNPQGAPMYWHPDFIAAYKRFLAAQADYARKSPYRDAILGMRMNFCAIGNEYLNASATGTDLSKWIVPDGASRQGMRNWTPEVSIEYERIVGEEYARLFLPDVFVFARAHMDQRSRAPLLELVRQGKIGWFHTGSMPIEPKNGWFQKVCRTFDDYTRPGLALGYMEPVSDSWGFHGSGGKQSKMAAPGPQANYWRLLLDLRYGISFIACYGNDLQIAYDGTHPVLKDLACQEEYRQAFEFAAKYAGYLNSPSVSPGAWIAMRQMPRAPGEEGLLITDDAEFLLRRLPDKSRGAFGVGPEDQRFGPWTRVLPAGETMRFDLDDRFAASIAGKPSRIQIVYLDNRPGELELRAAGTAFDISLKNTGRWETARFEIESSAFAPDGDGADLALGAGAGDLAVHLVEVCRP